MNLAQRVRGARGGERSSSGFGLDAWAKMFGGNSYGPPAPVQTLTGSTESINQTFEGIVRGAYQDNGVVFACTRARLMLFAEARFQFRQIRKGRPGDLFGTTDLRVLEHPWTNGTTGDLLARMLQDGDMAGNAYIAKRKSGELRRLRPDWVTIVVGSKTGSRIDDEVVAYAYYEGGNAGKDPEILLPGEVAHWAPIPDPLAKFRGMSWLTPIIREVDADSAMREHKTKFLENGATVNMVVKVDPSTSYEAFEKFKALMEDQHAGLPNAYKTMYLGGGADITPVGADMKQLDFKVIQGHGETRIAAAAGVPPIIVGLSEGLAAATYSNYGQARRAFADGTMRYLWRSAASALAVLVKVPADSELWYDARDISFLQEDEKDAADITAVQAQSIRTLVDGGYTAQSATKAVMAGDLDQLEHTGYFSVQLLVPGTKQGDGSAAEPPADPKAPETAPAAK